MLKNSCCILSVKASPRDKNSCMGCHNVRSSLTLTRPVQKPINRTQTENYTCIGLHVFYLNIHGGLVPVLKMKLHICLQTTPLMWLSVENHHIYTWKHVFWQMYQTQRPTELLSQIFLGAKVYKAFWPSKWSHFTQISVMWQCLLPTYLGCTTASGVHLRSLNKDKVMQVSCGR